MKNVLLIFLLLNNLVLANITSTIKKIKFKTIVLEVYDNNKFIGLSIIYYHDKKFSFKKNNEISISSLNSSLQILKKYRIISFYETDNIKSMKTSIILNLNLKNKNEILNDCINKNNVIQKELYLRTKDIQKLL